MRELYVEGVAIHGGPESCVDDPRGRGEALTGARAGRAIEPRNWRFGVPTLSQRWKATPLVALCKSLVGPARSENHGMYGTSMRENREVPLSPVRVDHRAGRSGNAEAVRLG
jgi:RNA-directed DNA polymerase